jgi:predicted house-cleaning noncanonical NTP pyrophosphatase (MazG superfamily)
MEFNKLVRDKIPEIIKSRGDIPFVHIATEKEYEDALVAKLGEEVKEFLADHRAGEVADILEVLHAICNLKNISLNELEEIRKKKVEERGSFEQRIILEKTEDR